MYVFSVHVIQWLLELRVTLHTFLPDDLELWVTLRTFLPDDLHCHCLLVYILEVFSLAEVSVVSGVTVSMTVMGSVW